MNYRDKRNSVLNNNPKIGLEQNNFSITDRNYYFV